MCWKFYARRSIGLLDWRWRLVRAQLLGQPPRFPLGPGSARDWPLADSPVELLAGRPRLLARLGREAKSKRALSKVWEIYSGNVWDRTLVEARLLTGEPLGRIGKRLGISARVLRLYERLFFDVRRRLKSPDYVVCHAVGYWDGPDDQARPLPVVVKRFAYCFGCEVLEGVLAAFAEQINPRRIYDAALSKPLDALERGRIRLAVLMHQVPYASLHGLVALASVWMQGLPPVGQPGSFLAAGPLEGLQLDLDELIGFAPGGLAPEADSDLCTAGMSDCAAA